MLTPTSVIAQASPNPPARRGVSTSGTATANTAANVNGRSNDQIALSQTSQARNPYQGTAPAFSTVKVDRWGQGNNDSVVQILLNQGYSQREIYGKSGNGRTLLDEVTRVNGLRNANFIRAGQDLIVPSKQAPEGEQAPTQTQRPQPEPRVETPPAGGNQPPAPPANQNEAQPPRVETPPATQNQSSEEARVNQVRVDRWGQGPNSSLGAILKNQGFEHNQIFREDANGDSLLKKIARANGLENPDRILAGSTLNVPNSMEALAQMDIPEMPARAERPAPTAPPVETSRREDPPARVEIPATPVEPPATPVDPPARTETAPPANDTATGQPTANMGLLLDGIKSGSFTRQEFQYLNARSSRYAQMRARFSNDGYSNDELTELGRMERRYGVEFARLSASDDVRLPEFPQTSTNPDLAIQVRHYHESGPMFDRYSNGTMNSETAIQQMIRQRDEARRQEVR